jgi:ATP-dependent RNA helicase DHX8/PRP22
MPEGGLQRAAIRQSQLAKERKEKREQKLGMKNGGIDDDKSLNEIVIDKNEKRDSFIRNYTLSKRANMSIKEQKETLPIYKLKAQLKEAIKTNKILVVIGETGSGKTTQITQYLHELQYTKFGCVACTQPRRVAAMSVARRVADELGVKLGKEVGYSIRFEDCTSTETIIKYMTDGMLLREALIDPLLTKYSVIMLDEAHERTVQTDVLFALAKKACSVRPELRLIVSSATLDAVKFSSYFYDCKIFRIPGNTYDVEILYTQEPERDYLEAALTTVMQIHLTEPKGDVLLFLTGQEEIDTACQILSERMQNLGKDVPSLLVLPVYSALPSEMQCRIFDPAPDGSRKCIVATNIAEASLTIDGIYYVVDPGFAKIKVYNPKTGMDSLIVSPISQASANQRAGRAGRTGPGKCYRLYTLEAFNYEMLPATVPEIQRTNLANTVLILKAMGINDLINFDFMDPPPIKSMIAAMKELHHLGSLDNEGLLTKLGRLMAEFPLEPPLSKMLLTSVDLNCSDEITTIVAMLSVQNVFYRPREKQAIADQKRARFYQTDGDHLTMLAVYEEWQRNKCSNSWCYENFIHSRALKRAQDIRKQLIQIMDKFKLCIVSCGRNYAKIRKSIAAGFFSHAARKDPQDGYRTIIDNQQVYIHPSSALFNRNPEWVIYHELVMTSKEYMREVTCIDPRWLVDVATSFYRYTKGNLSKWKKQERLEPLHNKYEDPNAWRLSRRKG